MTLATLLVMSSAAHCFSVTAGSLSSEPYKRVVARGRLTGTRQVQQVVIWSSRSNSASGSGAFAHLAIEDVASGRRIWQVESSQALDINSVKIVDVDGDSIPEIFSLWQRGGSRGAALRVFHWNRSSRDFAELASNSADVTGAPVQSYRVRGRRIVIYKRGANAGLEFEVRGSEIVPLRGGGGVTTQTESGIEGVALISPTRPGPIREGEPDAAPFKTTLVILKASDGAEVSRLETGADGRFRVALPPGIYKVGPPLRTGRMLPRGSQETVTVAPGKFAHVTINFDSGIR